MLAQTEHVEAPKDWKPNIVRIAGSDMLTGEGARVWNQLRARDIRAAQPEHTNDDARSPESARDTRYT